MKFRFLSLFLKTSICLLSGKMRRTRRRWRWLSWLFSQRRIWRRSRKKWRKPERGDILLYQPHIRKRWQFVVFAIMLDFYRWRLLRTVLTAVFAMALVGWLSKDFGRLTYESDALTKGWIFLIFRGLKRKRCLGQKLLINHKKRDPTKKLRSRLSLLQLSFCCKFYLDILWDF